MAILKNIEDLSTEAQAIYARLYNGEAIYGYPEAPRIKVYMNARNREQVGEGNPVSSAVFNELWSGEVINWVISVIGSERFKVYELTREGKFLYEKKAGSARIRAKENELVGLGKSDRFVSGILQVSTRPPRAQKSRARVTRKVT